MSLWRVKTCSSLPLCGLSHPLSSHRRVCLHHKTMALLKATYLNPCRVQRERLHASGIFFLSLQSMGNWASLKALAGGLTFELCQVVCPLHTDTLNCYRSPSNQSLEVPWGSGPAASDPHPLGIGSLTLADLASPVAAGHILNASGFLQRLRNFFFSSEMSCL